MDEVQESVRVVDGVKLLTQKQTMDFLGIKSRTKLHYMRKEADFPVPIKFTSRSLFWRLDQLEAWLSDKIRN